MIDRFNVEIMVQTTRSLERCQLKHTDCSTIWEIPLVLIVKVNYVEISGYLIDRFNVQIMFYTTPSLERSLPISTICENKWLPTDNSNCARIC